MSYLRFFDVSLPLFVPLAVAYLLYQYGSRPLKVLKLIGVPIASGSRLFVGHGLQSFAAIHTGMYDFDCVSKHGSVFGLVEFTSPALVVTDPAFLKEVLIKQFNNFVNRRPLPMRGWLIFSLVDQRDAEWKRIRTILTPFFSSAKLKHNFPVMRKCSQTFVNNLQKLYESGNMFEAHSLCGGLSMDVICGCAFGLETDSQTNPNDPLINTMRKLSNISFAQPCLLLSLIFPKLSPLFELFGITMLPSGYLKFFEKTVRELVAQRIAENQSDDHKKYPDFMQTMVKARLENQEYVARMSHHDRGSGNTGYKHTEDGKHGLGDYEVLAQSLLFFLAGYDTTSITLSFLLYNLAVHSEIQEKVYKEICSVIGTEEPSYEKVLQLEYLDRCLHESQRLFPAIFRFDREASESTTVCGVQIPARTLIVVPIWAMHHDPQLWPEPDKFDPDRFTAEARSTRHEFAHIPFGTGQRSCIGFRFAELEIKTAIVDILRSFRLVINSRTSIPMELKPATLFLESKSGVWLSVEPRSA